MRFRLYFKKIHVDSPAVAYDKHTHLSVDVIVATIAKAALKRLSPTKTHCVWKILNGDKTSKAELLLVLQEISAQAWR